MQEYPGSTTTQRLIVKQFCICYSTHAHAHTVPANNFTKLQRQIPATNFRIQFNLPPPKPTFTQFNSFISQQSRWIPKTLIFRFPFSCRVRSLPHSAWCVIFGLARVVFVSFLSTFRLQDQHACSWWCVSESLPTSSHTHKVLHLR